MDPIKNTFAPGAGLRHTSAKCFTTSTTFGREPVTKSNAGLRVLKVKSGELLYGRKHAALETLKQSLRHQAFSGELQ